MTARIIALLIIVTFLGLLSCQDDEEVTTQRTTNHDLNGYVQKGPFINGTAITVSELSDRLIATGKNFTTQIVDNKGSFSVKEVELASDYVQLMAEGFYFDEVRGEKSAAQLTLFALANVSDVSSVNVNLLSHLEKDRVIYLMQEKEKSFAEAKRQAQREILAIFGIEKSNMTASELLDISQAGEDNAILLAISAILQGQQTVAELSELLANIITDIREDGVLDSESTQEKIRTNAMSLNLIDVRQHLEDRYEELGVNAAIANFEQYVDSDGDGFLNKDEDDTPDDFAFEPQVDVAINDTVTSNAIAISGLKEGSTARASVANGWLIVNGSVAPITVSGAGHQDTLSVAEVKNGDQVQVRLITSRRFADAVRASLTIGSVVQSFEATTDDYQPDSFSFAIQKDVAVSTYYTSDTIVISGLPYPAPAAVDNAILIKNGKEITGEASVINGDQVALRIMSDEAFMSSKIATLTINDMKADFEVITDDYTPNAFSFIPIENAEPGTTHASETITLAGLRYSTPIKIDGGVLFINGEEVSNIGHTVENGDQITVSLFADHEHETTSQANLSIGSFTISLSVTTTPNPWQRKADFPLHKKTYVNFSIGDKVYSGVYEDDYGSTSKDLYVYDPSTNIWVETGKVPESTTYHHYTTVVDNKAYCLMNTGFWEYDPTVNQWAQKTTIPNAELIEFDCILIGGNSKAYLINRLGELWVYTPTTDTWQQEGSAPFDYSYSSTSFVLKGNIYIIYPNNPNEPYPNNPFEPVSSHVWEYDIDSKTWIQKNDLSLTSGDASSFVTQNKAYFLPGTWHSEYAVYDQMADRWKIVDPKPGDYIQGISSYEKGYGIESSKFYEFTPPQN